MAEGFDSDSVVGTLEAVSRLHALRVEAEAGLSEPAAVFADQPPAESLPATSGSDLVDHTGTHPVGAVTRGDRDINLRRTTTTTTIEADFATPGDGEPTLGRCRSIRAAVRRRARRQDPRAPRGRVERAGALRRHASAQHRAQPPHEGSRHRASRGLRDRRADAGRTPDPRRPAPVLAVPARVRAHRCAGRQHAAAGADLRGVSRGPRARLPRTRHRLAGARRRDQRHAAVRAQVGHLTSSISHTSGGTWGLSGTGRRSSDQADPTTSVATRRQKVAAPGFSSWNGISHRPGCRRIASTAANRPTPERRAARTTKNSPITRGSVCTPRTYTNPAGPD